MSDDIDWGYAAHEAARKHLEKVQEAYWAVEEGTPEDEVESPAVGPFCGCDTCVIREVLAGAWPVIEEYVTHQVLASLDAGTITRVNGSAS